MNHFSSISYTISHIFLILFIYLFIVHRYSKITTILICFFSFSALRILDCFKLFIFPDSNLCYVIATIMQIILAQSTAIVISKEKNSQTLFVGLSASNYVIAGSVFAAVLKIYTGNSILALLGSFTIHLSILVFLFRKTRKICLKFQEKKYEKGLWELCLIPVFFYCSFSFTGFFPHSLYDIPANIPGILFTVITMFVSYLVVLHYLESESKRASIHLQNMLLESYIQGLENQHYLTEQAEQNLKILHHDMRHYSRIINSLLEQKKYEEIKKVNEHINNVADENKVVKYCSNLIVNTILSNMTDKAHSYGIQVRLEAIVPKEVPVNDYDFTLVIANLFENAINCVKDFEKDLKYIHVKIHCSQNHLLIQMENKYKGEILLDSVTGLPKSRKKGNHGLGMKSILAFSEKIGGSVGCRLDDNIFHIMLFAKF